MTHTTGFDPAPGTVARGYLEAVEQLPAGGPVRISVVVREGARDGPALGVTGSVHGGEDDTGVECGYHTGTPGFLYSAVRESARTWERTRDTTR